MTTTSDRLALLQRTKAGQRALLEEMYPDLDFSTVPFREYGRLFTGRKYVPGFVGGWKTYGRSNSEDPATREILPDYSGNGRDIRLYNFGFAGMSGYGGYHDDFADFSVNEPDASGNHIIGDVLHIVSVSGSVDTSYVVTAGQAVRLRVRVSGVSAAVSSGSINYLRLYFDKFTTESSLTVTEDGEYSADLVAPEGATRFYIYARHTGSTGWTPLDTEITVEQLPLYPGALVSDGVDDYGLCIKRFALPDDYTVVAVRKIISSHNSSIASKGSVLGAFLLDPSVGGTHVSAWSYGYDNSLNNLPALFSYQTKTSYNGTAISFGTEEDSESDLLSVFTHNYSSCAQAILYDLRIYDHSLTAEELQIVRDEMMSDYENATGGGIADIHYVADWDAKGRSNDEDEPMRSQWVDKATGKVIGLHNYAYAGMSGWGGYGIDCSKVLVNGPQDLVDGNVLQFNAIKNAANFLYPVSGMKSVSMKIMVDGISRAVTSGKANYLQIYFSSSGGERLQITGDGVHEVDLPVTEGSQWMYLYVAPGVSAPDRLPIDPVTVEILPSYPGALVSDGVDDYGLTREAINEEVGTMLVYARLIDESAGGYYILNTNNSSGDNGRLFVWRSGNRNYGFGLPSQSADKPPFVLTRVPQAPALPVYIASSRPGYYSACVIHHLILIREELDAAQLEFLKWKVEKEYRDWCRDNGYDYAINQLTA